MGNGMILLASLMTCRAFEGRAHVFRSGSVWVQRPASDVYEAENEDLSPPLQSSQRSGALIVSCTLSPFILEGKEQSLVFRKRFLTPIDMVSGSACRRARSQPRSILYLPLPDIDEAPTTYPGTPPTTYKWQCVGLPTDDVTFSSCRKRLRQDESIV